jgi:excisionase family DNA binding protein
MPPRWIRGTTTCSWIGAANLLGLGRPSVAHKKAAMLRKEPTIIDSEASQKPRHLTPPEVATLLRVARKKVLDWIRKGELRAVNVSNTVRPRYRISPDSLHTFLRCREVQPPQSRRRKRAPKGGPLDPELGKKLAEKGEATLVFGKYYRVLDGKTLYF